MQQTSCKKKNHFITFSLLVCFLFTKWQARKQSSFTNNVQITFMHLSSITVQTLHQTQFAGA